MNIGYYININYAPLLGIIFLIFFLLINKSLDQRVKHLFMVLILLEFVELIVYSVELEFATFDTLSMWRVALSVIGYGVRPFLGYLILKIELRKRYSNTTEIILLTPALLNLIVNLTAFFSPIAFSYTRDNQFVRGPLSYVTTVVLFFYIVVIVIEVLRSSAERANIEMVIVIGLALLIVSSVFIEMFFNVRSIGRTSIVIVTIFYYMFFQTEEYRTSLNKENKLVIDLTEKSRMDELTGLLNKLTFINETEKILREQEYESVALLFFDLDCFKEVNDTLGHLTGDNVLKDVAERLKVIFRNTDLIGRFGGDEFYVLLKNTNYHSLQEILKRTNKELVLTYRNGNVSVHITASIGAAYADAKQGEHVEISHLDLIRCADEALYEVKKRGKNQFYIVKI